MICETDFPSRGDRMSHSSIPAAGIEAELERIPLAMRSLKLTGRAGSCVLSFSST